MKKWTNDEVARLRQMAGLGWSSRKIAAELGRNPGQVQHKCSHEAIPLFGGRYRRNLRLEWGIEAAQHRRWFDNWKTTASENT